MDRYSGAYVVDRRSGGGRRRGRSAGALIAVLLILTAVICLLVIFLPRFTSGEAAVAAPQFGGKTFYLLATYASDDYGTACENAQLASARGGAGYIYNDGKYNVIAAAYGRESDARNLSAVNTGSYVVPLTVPASSLPDADIAAIEYLTGEWFDALSVAASELDRGNVTQAVADNAAANACKKLAAMACAVSDHSLGRALEKAAEYALSPSVPPLSYLRYVAVRGVAAAAAVLSP